MLRAWSWQMTPSSKDIGISAFKGANVQSGALGQFLAAVKAGNVERGSYLLVESLDRLSREEILPAHTLFLSIVQAGINLVTLADKRVYRAKSTNLVDMITSLVIMERAHEESKTKSLRVGAAWKQKRSKATQGQSDDVITHMEQLAAHPDQSRRFFSVGFRDAAVRAVFPVYGDPLRFEQQVIAGQSPLEHEGQVFGRVSSIDIVQPND